MYSHAHIIHPSIFPHKHLCRLLVLNFYPFLQKYVAPHTRDVSLVLAALVGAAHELVPPDVMAPVLRQLVDNFVHDRWGVVIPAAGVHDI